MRRAEGRLTLRVDWPACHARGLCAQWLPELVRLDEWGYPIIEGDVSPQLRDLARAAVAACPTSALRMLVQPAGAERSPRGVGGRFTPARSEAARP